MEERMPFGGKKTKWRSKEVAQTSQMTDPLTFLLESCVPYLLWESGTEPKECKHSVVLLWQEKVFIVLEDERWGGGAHNEHTEGYTGATGWRDGCKHLCSTAFNIIQWPCHCRLRWPSEQIICLIHETGLCWDYSPACTVEGIKWQSIGWSNSFSSRRSYRKHPLFVPFQRPSVCEECSLPHSSGPRWRSAEAEGCPFGDASPPGCFGTSKGAAPPAWWCLLPGSRFDWPPGIPPLPADASLPGDGESKSNSHILSGLLGRKSELLQNRNIWPANTCCSAAWNCITLKIPTVYTTWPSSELWDGAAGV